ncbi:hypothetical protein IPL68_05775 [Candidatus Saccharibacteria bacterium]|nr:MAG: hypothetical protein IPL68_05775 [Candidatus Saccharibacteria bacterium]
MTQKLYGSTLQDFTARMASHANAEIASTLDIVHFIKRAEDLYGYPHFIADLTGSLCEVVEPNDPCDPVLKMLDENVTLIYIQASKEHEETLRLRNVSDPKPSITDRILLQKSYLAY